MKKPCFTVLYLNVSYGLLEDHEKKIKQRMNVFYKRKQAKGEWEDSTKSNRIFTVYKCYIFEKPNNGDIDFILNNNFNADQYNVSIEERISIKEKLKRALLHYYPQLRKAAGQISLNFNYEELK